jgi:hypothetical protein
MDLASGWQAKLRLVAVFGDHTVGRLFESAAFHGRAADRVEQAGLALSRPFGSTTEASRRSAPRRAPPRLDIAIARPRRAAFLPGTSALATRGG